MSYAAKQLSGKVPSAEITFARAVVGALILTPWGNHANQKTSMSRVTVFAIEELLLDLVQCCATFGLLAALRSQTLERLPTLLHFLLCF